MRSTILVYGGPGAMPGSVLGALREECDPRRHDVRLIGREVIRSDKKYLESAALLVMPGGADKPYCADLNGRGNANIRSVVENGIPYFGICASSYYASRRIVFHKGLADEITGDRELGFFPGTAIGSILEFGPAYDKTMRSVAAPRLVLPDGVTMHAYYHGGCYLQPDEGHKINKLASYADLPGQPAAIVEVRVGRGRAILSGVHLEVSAENLAWWLSSKPATPRFETMLVNMRATETQRRQLLRGLLEVCGVELKPAPAPDMKSWLINSKRPALAPAI